MTRLVGVARAARGAIAFNSVLWISIRFWPGRGRNRPYHKSVRRCPRERGDDKADVETGAARLDARDHATLSPSPCLCRIAHLGIAAPFDRASECPVDGVGVTLADDDGVGVERAVTGRAEDIVDAVRLAPGHGLGPTVRTVAAQREPGFRPIAANAPHEPANLPASFSDEVLPVRTSIAVGRPLAASWAWLGRKQCSP